MERAGSALAWERVRTTLKVESGSSTLAVVKHLVGGGGHRHRLVLLDNAEARRLVDQLQACGLSSLPDPGHKRGADLYRVTWEGMGAGAVRMNNPHASRDGRLSGCLRVLEAAVDTYIGYLPWRDVFFDESRLGYLRAESTPAARVWVDGMDTGEETPLAALALEVGVHDVTFVSEGLRRSYDVRILSRATTNLDVDLR